ncbi:unnamed protein product, partial [Coregonus sp. 'balchen']
RCQAEARAQQESREEEVSGLRAELQEAQGRLQQCRGTMEHLRSDLEHAQRQTRQAEDEASDRESRLRGQEAELSRLRAVLQEAESRAADTEARLQPLTQSLELYRTKYQACITKISQQDSTLQAQDEDLKEARAQVVEREEHVLRLCAQAVVLQGELKAHSAQLESGDDALSALSQHLRDTQRDLEDSRKHSQECEMVISTLRDSTATLRRQVEEQEESVVKSQADFSVYRATHIHSVSDYDSQLSRIQELQQAFSQAVEQCAQGSQDLSVCQSEVRQLREEVSRLTQLKDNTVAEVLRLQEAGRQLQAEAMMEGQRRLEEVGALAQTAARLEQDLQAAHSQCAQRQQAVQKRDTLLRRSEADLLEARETLRSRAVAVERQAAAARGLEADVQRARREGQQREAESQELARQEEKVLLVEGGQHRAQQHLAERVAEVVRAEQAQRTLQAELRTLKERLRTTEHELQGYRTQVESLKKEAGESRQAQLSAQQEANTHQQGAQQLEAELTSTKDTLRTLQQQLRERERTVGCLQERVVELQSTTQRLHEEQTACQAQLQQCRRELESRVGQSHSHSQEMNVLQETVSRLRECVEEAQASSRQGTMDTAAAQHSLRELRLELASTQASHRESMELLAEQSRETAGLRSELSRLQQRSSQLSEEREGQEERTRQLAAELHRLRTASRQSLDEARSCEGRLAELSAQLGRSQRWGQEQLVALEAREEEVVLMKVEMASLRENYHAKVDALHSQLDSMEHKYSTSANEVEVLRQSLGNARSDSSLLHRESELVVTNVNQWVKEQKQGNEKLNLKIKDQSKKIIHLTAEKDHLQESVEGLHEEMKRLKAELDESRIEAERIRASQASVSDQRQRGGLGRLPIQLLHTDGETLPAPDQEESYRETQELREQSQYQSRDRDKLAAGDLFSSVLICSDCERSLEWSGRQPVEEECSGCQPPSALASACACLAGRGATFAAEVARRVALRALERRPLPCGHHHWSRPRSLSWDGPRPTHLREGH